MEEITKITKTFSIPEESFEEIKKAIKDVSDFKKEIEGAPKENLSKLLETILGGGVALDVSDIHVEPGENDAKIRIRIDGMLQDAALIDSEIYQGLLSRVKLLSEIKLNISDRPQDGRFSILATVEGKETSIEVRCSSLPSEHGESIVLRILNPKSLINLKNLGLRNDLFKLFQKEIKKPNGMILITGPTGSGKTTTLYAFLKEIQNPEIKIITIEDPIEYHLEGISQTQVNPAKGYDFASGLQSIMRQDPDVILVGEIRDSKTCKIALQSALTGHLVFSTLHTNDAVGTVARLTNLGGELADMGPAINLIIAQRLIREVCDKCKKTEKVSPEELALIKKELPESILKSAAIKEELKDVKIDENLKVSKVKGCKLCNFTGYRNRIGIFEAFSLDDEMEKFILKNPSIAVLKDEAVKRGLITMKQDGLVKVLKGLTTIEEVERITG